MKLTEEEWVHKVALIDTKAANYMLSRKGRDPLGEYRHFAAIFAWFESPQGAHYWAEIDRRLENLP